MASTLVLIPGLACTEALYAPQIAALSDRIETLVADHRQDDSIPAIAERLLRNAPERFALAGLSMGGYIAMEVMRQAPERVERLALMDTSARPDSPEASGDRRRMIALAEAGRLAEIVRTLWPRLVHPDHESNEALREVVSRMMSETGAEAFIRQERAIMARPDSRPLLAGVEIPTLILVGEGDRLTPPELAREMADLVEWASLVVVPGAGHLATLEQPERVNEALKEWLEHS